MSYSSKNTAFLVGAIASISVLFFSSSVPVYGVFYYDEATGTYIDLDAVEQEVQEPTPTPAIVQPTQEILDVVVPEEELLLGDIDSQVEISSSQTVETMQALTDDTMSQQVDLLEYLDEQEQSLLNTYMQLRDDMYPDVSLGALQCLGLTAQDEQIRKEINSIFDTLGQRIVQRSATIRGDIQQTIIFYESGVIGNDVFDAEYVSLLNDIDTYTQTTIDLVSAYVDEMLTSVNDVLDQETTSNQANLIASYIENTALMDDLRDRLDEFEDSSFFSQTVAGPRAGDLFAGAQDAYALFRASLVADRQSEYGSFNISQLHNLLDSQQRVFDRYANDLVSDLFPHDGIQEIYNSYRTLLVKYNSTSQCVALANAQDVPVIVPTLLSKITTLENELEQAYADIPEMDDADRNVLAEEVLGEFEEWFSDVLSPAYRTVFNNTRADYAGFQRQLQMNGGVSLDQLESLASHLEDIVITQSPTGVTQYSIDLPELGTVQMDGSDLRMVDQVLSILESMRADASSISAFEDRLERAYARGVIALEALAGDNSRQAEALRAIMAGIYLTLG